ncbi:hypothetical protein ACSLUB_11365 [Bordetella hinzii]|uniref:hypothetical protein n=1 Tax=Bordetella hinzii TaxID=103855 RepID=UPI003F1B7C25
MSLYNLLFGMNSQGPLLLAAVGIHENDVQRLRDVSVTSDGSEVFVYTRTGGGNREDYPNEAMRSVPGWVSSEDDDFDCTYCTDTIRVAPEFHRDVAALGDFFAHGMRPEFAAHLAKTLKREPTEEDIAQRAIDAERKELERTRHVKANGHTFVPYDDSAMETALRLAEANGGSLRSCWGILPIKLNVRTDYQPWPHAKVGAERIIRANIDYDFKWGMDTAYWQHCVGLFSEKYPLSMAKIGKEVEAYLAREQAV